MRKIFVIMYLLGFVTGFEEDGCPCFIRRAGAPESYQGVIIWSRKIR